MLRRGDSMLALGDVSAARLFYERAAAAGSGEAATALGKTHDPEILSRLGVRSISSDRAAAARWYRAALALSDAAAGPLLARLEGQHR
jgi:TPR repeat protein